MSVRRVVVVAVAAASLALGGAVTSASTAGPADQPKRHAQVKDAPPVQAVGLIVKTKAVRSTDEVRAAARSAVAGRASVSSVRRMSGRMNAVRFTKVVDREDAIAAARAMEQRSDVEWAAPDTIHRPSATKPPVTTNDTYYTGLQHLWDRRSSADSLTSPWFSGGYSTRAPSLWRATAGASNVIVAILDTGITNHKDFNLRRLTGGGYDFVSAQPLLGETGLFQTNDGNGRDSNPADPGDWLNAGDCGYDPENDYASSWHGTHVAGIVAAQSNNAMGVAGVAPGVKFAPVRVVGRCGAIDSDILDAITWSTGGHVDGVPDNPVANHAKVVNLSLGSDDLIGEAEGDTSVVDFICQSYAPVVAAARARGAVVVAAAGNAFIDARYTIPAACPGVFTVGATGSLGLAAAYSNYGSKVKMSAPGGDIELDGPGGGILSTYNKGQTAPGSATYTRLEGTSMAAPMVSAGAALLYSAGMKTAQEVEQGLLAARQPFPTYDTRYVDPDDPENDFNCRPPSPYSCGVGILDLGRVQALLKGKRPTITGTAKVGQTLKTSTYGQWNNSNAGFDIQWYRDADEINGATGLSYKLTSADLGKKIKVKITPAIEAFAPLFHTSPATAAVAKATSTVSASVPAKASSQSFVTVSATVTAPGIPASALVGVLEVKDENTVIATKNLTAGDLGKASITLPVTLSKGTHRIRIRFGGTDVVAASISASRYITAS
jgi:serine protease